MKHTTKEKKLSDALMKFLTLWDSDKLKLEKGIMGKTVDVKAIRVYLSELNKNINSTTERGEQPKVYAKLIKREKTGESEIELFFIGTEKDRHIEDLSYSESDPKTWKSWGEIVISPEDALNLAAFLSASVTLAKLKKPKEGDETVG